MTLFTNRSDAGRQLANALKEYQHTKKTILIALPRGGVVVGFEIASSLHIPLDIVCPRKIGAPFNPELALGAVTETGEAIFSEELIKELGISKTYLDEKINKEKCVAAERLFLYRQGKPPRILKGQKVILVDDGLATGATMRAAIKTVKAEDAAEVILALPVAPLETLKQLRKKVDKAICLYTPDNFFAVGQFYEEFEQVSDETVSEILSQIPLPKG